MAKLKCLCGEKLSNVSSPNETEGVLIKDQHLEFDDGISVYETGRIVWECGECGRLAVSYPDKKDCRVKWYRPEDGKPGGLMKFDL